MDTQMYFPTKQKVNKVDSSLSPDTNVKCDSSRGLKIVSRVCVYIYILNFLGKFFNIKTYRLAPAMVKDMF